MPFIRAYIGNFGKKLRFWRFFKDPVLCTGVFSIVFFAVLLTGANVLFQPVAGIGSYFLSNLSSSILNSGLAFAEPVQNIIVSSPEISLTQGNSIIKTSLPNSAAGKTLGSVGGVLIEKDRNAIIEYIVESGDTLSSIAAEFNISINTILWANNLNKGAALKVGQKIVVLPVSGVIYHIKNGDTLSQIAKTYKSQADEIVAFNELTDENDIFIGDILVLPGGVMPVLPKTDYAQIPLASSYFICPLSACRMTQGLHWYNAVDFAGKCGDPIYAAAAGTVQKVKFGWNNGSGNYLTILHPNGVVTFYGHLNAALVSSGQTVSQGDMIALLGGKPGTPGAGQSTGCHLHLTVIGAPNPFAR